MMALLLSIALLSAAPSSAPAASPSTALFKKGKAAFELGKLSEALDAFEQAQALEPSAELLLNIAQCQRGLGRRDEAISSLEKFLELAPKHSLRKAVEGTLADLRAETSKDAPTKVELTPAPVEAPIAPAPAPEQKKVWPWVVGGVAVAAAIGAGIAIGVVASRPAAPGLPDLGTVRVPPR